MPAGDWGGAEVAGGALVGGGADVDVAGAEVLPRDGELAGLDDRGEFAGADVVAEVVSRVVVVVVAVAPVEPGLWLPVGGAGLSRSTLGSTSAPRLGVFGSKAAEPVEPTGLR